MSRKIQLTNALNLAIAAVASFTDKLAAAQEKVENLQSQVTNIDAIEALKVGDSVEFKVGRGETRTTVVGTIRQIKAGEVKVEGEGEDAVTTVGDRLFKLEFSRSGDEFDSEFTVQPESQVSIPAAEVVEEVQAASNEI
jgi:protein involved in polysaccharide export with SLBB domain